MNITHAKNELVSGDHLVAIFNRQKELMEKYHHIEARSGLCQTEDNPLDLDDKRGQARIKDFAWRIMEEVGEAFDSYTLGEEEHFLEELIDGLHFLTEMTILSGFIEIDLVEPSGFNHLMSLMPQIGSIGDGPIDSPMYINFESSDILDLGVISFELTQQLGMMCNTLKNKPWKQTHMKTDKDEFLRRLRKVWYVYLTLIGRFLTVEGLTQVYLKKSQVNQFRQRSNY